MSDDAPIERTNEATVPVAGRLLEAKGTNDSGGRVFRFRLLESDTVGRNLRRYPSAVVKAAASLYNGAKAFDRHRSPADLESSTIAGLVGVWRNVEATADGIEADLHLLPSAQHTAEALDASLAGEAQGLPPLIGSSHDVYGRFRVLREGGQEIKEATAIVAVNSVDVVADPAAGGRVTRMVAGGIEPDNPEESAMPTFDELMELINGASPEQKAVLADSLGVKAPVPTAETADTPPPDPAPAAEPEPEPALVGAAAEAGVYARDSIAGRSLVREALAEAGFGERVSEAAEALKPVIPERFRESDLVALLEQLKPRLDMLGLRPQAPHVGVTKDVLDRKLEALDAMFISNPSDPKCGTGYRSLKDAFLDITGTDARRFFGPTSEDFARHVLRESLTFLDSGRPAAYDSSVRATESGTTSTWAEILGDSITRRMVAEYNLLGLNDWRRIVSATPPVNDFRTQRRDRMGGYGTLPAVAQGAPYQPLTTPGDEEATYTITKRGGTEDLTIEAIANDDLGALQRIPAKLGRAAAQTLYRFVFDILVDNAAVTYDSVALFDNASHGNTDTSAALSHSTLFTGWRKMVEQTAYGNTSEVLGATPRYLIVPPELWDTAFQLSTSAVAKPASGDTSDMPNMFQGLTPILVPYYTDANDWFLVADPASIPTIEVGFYRGQQTPELFVQNDPTVGSLFNADKITWKIRHIYSGTVLDHRGFYRGVG